MLEFLVGAGLDDGLAWRNLLAPGKARAGWECVGPSGLVRRLGVLFGVPTEPAPRAMRAQHMEARLAAYDDGSRHFSASRAADSAGVAAYLLALCDELRLCGWDGRPLKGSVRMEELSELERVEAGGVLPQGEPHRALAVLRALESARELPLPLRVTLSSPRAHFPPLHQAIFDALKKLGVDFDGDTAAAEAVEPGSDLGQLKAVLALSRRTTKGLRGDGSVLFLEAETPWEAADLLGAWLSDHPAERRTLIVPREGALLDAVMRRRGLPGLGVHSQSRWRPVLQVLPLRLALLFSPRDPARAIELLSLPTAPLPGYVRRALIGALQEMPGIDSDAWHRAVEESLKEAREKALADARVQKFEDAEAEALAQNEVDRISAAVDRWFGSAGHEPEVGVPVSDAMAVCRLVAQWAQARAAGEEGQDASFGEAAHVARSLEQALGYSTPDALIPRLRLEQLHDAVLGAGAAARETEGSIGRPAVVHSPGAVLEADEVIWWSFDEKGAAATGRSAPPLWTRVEVEALAAAGVHVASSEARRVQERAEWMRPILSARSRVVFVRTRCTGGEPTQPHPFEDELSSLFPRDAFKACTVTAERAVDGEPVPVGTGWSPLSGAIAPHEILPNAVWQLAAEHLAPHVPLSPTAIEGFLGCPLKWALGSVAGLKGGALGGLPEGSQLVGSFAHRLLQDLFFAKDAPAFDTVTSDEASKWVGSAFDTRVEQEAAPLLRPGNENDRRRARDAIVRAAANLVTMLKDSGWRPIEPEAEVEGRFDGLAFEGRIDLLLEKDGKKAVLDLKLGKTENRRAELRDGRALQLSLYSSALAGGKGDWPPTAYMTVGDARVLTASSEFGSQTEKVQGPTQRQTVKAAEQMWKWWRKVVDEGMVPARHEELVEEALERSTEIAGESPLDNVFLELRVPCGYCDFQALCATRVTREGTR